MNPIDRLRLLRSRVGPIRSVDCGHCHGGRTQFGECLRCLGLQQVFLYAGMSYPATLYGELQALEAKNAVDERAYRGPAE